MANGDEEKLGSYGLVHEKSLSDVASQLDEASYLLNSWATSEQSDSVRHQELRKREYAQACGLLKEVYADVFKTGKQLRLTMPAEGEVVRARSLSRNAYDLYEVGYGGDLEPGQSMILKTHQSLMNTDQRASNVYFGDYRKYLEVADIARILGEGGSLELVD